jgi:hypothetical protein
VDEPEIQLGRFCGDPKFFHRGKYLRG